MQFLLDVKCHIKKIFLIFSQYVPKSISAKITELPCYSYLILEIALGPLKPNIKRIIIVLVGVTDLERGYAALFDVCIFLK